MTIGENELMLNVRNQNELDVENLQEHSGDSECDSNATKYTSTQSWNYSCYMMDFALSTNNTELLEAMTKAQDLLKKNKKNSLLRSKQTDIQTFLKL